VHLGSCQHIALPSLVTSEHGPEACGKEQPLILKAAGEFAGTGLSRPSATLQDKGVLGKKRKAGYTGTQGA
jgi:hypothetical protein